jgi:hypothetical protein
MIGSEGTLAVVTEVRNAGGKHSTSDASHAKAQVVCWQVELRLFGIPEAEKTMICSFPTIQAAVDMCATVMQMGIPVARMELMDENAVEAVNYYSKLNNKVQPSLIIEHHGSPSEIEEQSAIVQEIARDFEAEDIALSSDPEERKKLWHGRHTAWYATTVSFWWLWCSRGCSYTNVFVCSSGSDSWKPRAVDRCCRAVVQVDGRDRRDPGGSERGGIVRQHCWVRV